MRTTYRVLAYLLALSVAVQTSLIAFGAFALENNIDNGPVADGDTTGVTLHHSFAYIVLLLAVALLAVSLVHHSHVGSCEAADAPEVPPGHRLFSLRRL